MKRVSLAVMRLAAVPACGLSMAIVRESQSYKDEQMHGKARL